MRKLWMVAPLLLAAVAVLAACGSNDTSDEALTVGGSDETVTIDNSKYSPGNLQVPVGATVTWVNEDSAVHDAKADDGSWETEHLSRGDSGSVTFETAGEYSYYCTLHPNMKARITVVEE